MKASFSDKGKTGGKYKELIRNKTTTTPKTQQKNFLCFFLIVLISVRNDRHDTSSATGAVCKNTMECTRLLCANTAHYWAGIKKAERFVSKYQSMGDGW